MTGQTVFPKYSKIYRIGHEENNGIVEDGTLLVQEKMDGANCLPYDQRVRTKNGSKPIGEIVNNKNDVEVLSYNKETGCMEYRPVTGYMQNKGASNWLRLEFDTVSKSSMMKVTGDHEIYTDSGKVKAENINKGDRILTEKVSISGKLRDIIIGSLIGDASLENVEKSKNEHLSEKHGENQHDYLEWKSKKLQPLVSNIYTEMSSYDEDSQQTEKLCMTTKSSSEFNRISDKFYKNGRKIIPDDISLNWRSIAVWFCDDGSSSHINTDKQRERVLFHTQGFERGDVEILKSALNQNGLECRIANYGSGPLIELDADSTETLYQNISKYIPDSMKRKIPEKFWESEERWDISYERKTTTVTNITDADMRSEVGYDIEVSGNHNYVTKGIIVSNCRFMLEENLEEEYQTDDRDLVFGSKNVAYKNEKDIDSSFQHAVDYVRENVNVSELRGIESGYDGHLVCYVEAMHSHTLDYGEPVDTDGATVWKDVPNVLGFDIRVVEDDDMWFEDHQTTEIIHDVIGLDVVPTYYYGIVDDMPEELHPNGGVEFPESEYRDGLPEGVVIRNESSGQTAKIRTQQFKEKHDTQSVTDPDDYDPDDSVVLARQYATEARILKIIHKFEDRGKSVDSMGVMEDLWRAVFDDIIEEEYEDIFLGNHTIDTKQFRSEVASQTANVLETYLNRPDGSVLNEPTDE